MQSNFFLNRLSSKTKLLINKEERESRDRMIFKIQRFFRAAIFRLAKFLPQSFLAPLVCRKKKQMEISATDLSRKEPTRNISILNQFRKIPTEPPTNSPNEHLSCHFANSPGPNPHSLIYRKNLFTNCPYFIFYSCVAEFLATRSPLFISSSITGQIHLSGRIDRSNLAPN